MAPSLPAYLLSTLLYVSMGRTNDRTDRRYSGGQFGTSLNRRAESLLCDALGKGGQDMRLLGSNGRRRTVHERSPREGRDGEGNG